MEIIPKEERKMKAFVALLAVFCLAAFSAEAQIGWTANDFAKAGWRDTGVHPALGAKEKKFNVTATTYAKDNWTQVVYSRLSAGDNAAKSVEVVFCRSKEQLTDDEKQLLLNSLPNGRFVVAQTRNCKTVKNRWRQATIDLLADYKPGTETMTVYRQSYRSALDAVNDRDDRGGGKPEGDGRPAPQPKQTTSPKRVIMH